MVNAKQMILIGSSGQNAGKTTLAKALIHTWKGRFPLVALKITSVAQHGALCPRGGQGCGACVNIKEDFVLEEEQGESPNKDTAQLRAAGADQVFWLRSLYGSLGEAYEHFCEKVPPHALIICESNSLREVVSPGCFIMLINHKNPAMKPTAARVLERADLIVQNDQTPEAIAQLVSHIQVEQDDTGGLRISLKRSE
jgi:hypothetical protein